MAYNTKNMLTDANGKLIPQIYDPATDEYKPLSTDVYNNINVNNFPATQQVEGNVQLTGSFVALKGDPFPTTAEEGNDLLVNDPATGETEFYVYISGDWRLI